MDKTLYLIDGHSLIFKMYYAFLRHPMINSKGADMSILFGFTKYILELIEREKPSHLAIAFDPPGGTFRHEMYAEYKGTRDATPQLVIDALEPLCELCEAMKIPVLMVKGYEADDVIGTVGRICGNCDWDCVIVTGDKDSLQLIDEHVRVKLVVSKSGQTVSTLYDVDKFREEYGFEPRKMVDLKALMGDSSDNIPGVAGVGPKTAAELLMNFGSLDGVYKNLGDPSIRPKLREKLEAGKDAAYLSFDLATIRPEAPIDFTPADDGKYKVGKETKNQSEAKENNQEEKGVNPYITDSFGLSTVKNPKNAISHATVGGIYATAKNGALVRKDGYNYYFNENLQLVREEKIEGNQTTVWEINVYDEIGLLKEDFHKTKNYDRRKEYEYDENGNCVKEIGYKDNELWFENTYTYSEKGNLIFVVGLEFGRELSPKGKVYVKEEYTDEHYDEQGVCNYSYVNEESGKTLVKNDETWTYEYDEEGWLKKEVSNLGNYREFDEQGNIIEVFLGGMYAVRYAEYEIIDDELLIAFYKFYGEEVF